MHPVHSGEIQVFVLCFNLDTVYILTVLIYWSETNNHVINTVQQEEFYGVSLSVYWQNLISYQGLLTERRTGATIERSYSLRAANVISHIQANASW